MYHCELVSFHIPHSVLSIVQERRDFSVGQSYPTLSRNIYKSGNKELVQNIMKQCLIYNLCDQLKT